MRVPLPLLLITCGVVASLLGLHIEFEPETFLLLFIPPLLFSDAYLMPLRDFRELRWPILLLAVGLVIFSTLVGGYFIHWLLPVVPLAAAFALAAILSPTDPVAVGGMIDATMFRDVFYISCMARLCLMMHRGLSVLNLQLPQP
ncbi:cation:proton antiporter domain-containing protein [Acetobacter okinawensis]|uniref:cation:proton antiporter domain-containing protein n=1 Tax=Acetobacter okinawensis TaxID=1076594 RepID=UPI00241293BA|nr:cation:proton antiporter [Acetobacter okinawensis]